MTQVFGAELPFQVQLMPDDYELKFRKRKAQLTKHYSKLAQEAIAKLPKPDKKTQLSLKGSVILSVTNELRLIEFDNIDEGEYIINWRIAEGDWTLICADSSSTNEVKYSVGISREAKTDEENLSPNNIRLESRSSDMKSILALWKILERLLKDHLKKDDLVQLFGYYQYNQSYTVDLVLHSEELQTEECWKVLKLISKGNVNRRILSIPDLAELFEIKERKLMECLRTIKEIGYEIRSRNTNPQIPENHILIPYSFPSLNERSLQRATNL